jgi:Phosphatase
MSKARNRPPRLESKIGRQEISPPPTLPELLERAHVAGRAAVTGPSELRRMVERAAIDRPQPVLLDEAWAAVHDVFGSTSEAPAIDPNLTIAAASRAVARIAEVAGRGAPIALATSRPASLLTVHLALARLARISGGDVIQGDDSGPLRVDGRTARVIRWVDGVAVVTDGNDLCSTRGTEAPLEWLFLIPRPALVVADGPYADVAIDAGIEVIAPAGLDHCTLAVGRSRDRNCSVIPMWTDCPPDAYRPLLEVALTAALSPNGVAHRSE